VTASKTFKTLAAASVAMLFSASAGAGTNTNHVSGHFDYVEQLATACGNLAVLCAKGHFSGGIQGSFVNTITSLVPSELVLQQVDFYTGNIVISTLFGQLKCGLAGALQNAGDGEFGEICVITGGTGVFAGATGYLQLVGGSTVGPNGLPIGLKGGGDYIGTIVTPANPNP
jgi:hypothetical protein